MFFIFDVAPFVGYTISQKILIYAIASGAFLAFFAYWFVQNVIGSLVRKLLKEGRGEENARTLGEIGADKLIYRFLLRNGSTLRNLVSCLNGELEPLKKEEKTKENPSFGRRLASFFKKLLPKRYNYSDAKFYISEDNFKKAEDRHSKSSSALWLILVFVLCALCSFGMTYLLPIIMDFIR